MRERDPVNCRRCEALEAHLRQTTAGTSILRRFLRERARDEMDDRIMLLVESGLTDTAIRAELGVSKTATWNAVRRNPERAAVVRRQRETARAVRIERCHALHAQGASYHRIAAELGISYTWARKIILGTDAPRKAAKVKVRALDRPSRIGQPTDPPKRDWSHEPRKRLTFLDRPAMSDSRGL